MAISGDVARLLVPRLDTCRDPSEYSGLIHDHTYVYRCSALSVSASLNLDCREAPLAEGTAQDKEKQKVASIPLSQMNGRSEHKHGPLESPSEVLAADPSQSRSERPSQGCAPAHCKLSRPPASTPSSDPLQHSPNYDSQPCHSQGRAKESRLGCLRCRV